MSTQLTVQDGQQVLYFGGLYALGKGQAEIVNECLSHHAEKGTWPDTKIHLIQTFIPEDPTVPHKGHWGGYAQNVHIAVLAEENWGLTGDIKGKPEWQERVFVAVTVAIIIALAVVGLVALWHAWAEFREILTEFLPYLTR